MNPIRNYMNRMKVSRLRTKILLSNLVIILFITAAIGGAAIYASNRFIEANTRDLSMQVVHQVSENIDNRAKEIFNSTIYLISDILIRQTVSEKSEPITAENYPLLFTKMEFLLAQYGNSTPYINSVIIKTNSGYVFWWGNRKEVNQNLSTDNVTILANKAVNYLHSTGKDIAWAPSLRDADEVVLIRNFVNLNQVDQSFGSVIFNVDADYFRALREDSSIIQKNNIVILGDKDAVLVGGDNQVAQDFISQRVGSGFSEMESSSLVQRVGKTKYLMTQEITASLKWRVLCFIPLTELLANTQVLALVILVVCVISLFISLGIALFLSKSTTRNIKILEMTMRRVEDGNFNVRIDPLGGDEIGMLAVRFNFMVSRINELINSVYKERLAKQHAEFTVLMAQINPHFLYNTLGTIKWYSRMKDQPDIERMVAALIDLLKSSVRRESEFHTLEAELNNVQTYIYIQKIGYGNAFEMEFETDSDLLTGYVPYFTLQPIVENAILHGLELSKGNGLIRISSQREHDDILLTVEDNGIGMSREKIAAILQSGSERGPFPGMISIGVRSINERIQLYYGEGYGLSYESEPGVGTKAILRLPYRASLGEDEGYVSSYDR